MKDLNHILFIFISSNVYLFLTSPFICPVIKVFCHIVSSQISKDTISEDNVDRKLILQLLKKNIISNK
uniref:Uncharacterized protein n=1 Tax=Strongyloides papillosus TaxID=174720 RepID=A0A0N5BWP5_STREA